MTERFSVYHVPNPTAKLYGIGSAILGRCVYTGNTLAPPWPKYFSPSVPPHPARASVYGFHATLVAPFRTLVPVQTLAETLENLCQTIDSFEVGPLELSLLEPGFPALIPKEAPPALSALEERLVKTFAAYALPIEPEDLARREPLTARQRALAKKWGYPYVLDQFRYHLTLGDPLNETADDLSRDKLNYLDLLHSLLSDEIVASHHLDSLCLCRQASKGGPFKVITVSNFRTDPTRSEPTGADPTGSDLMCPDPTGSDPMCPDPTGNPFSQNGKGQAVSDNQLTGDPKGLHQASFPDPRRDPPSYYRRDEHSSDYRDNLVDFRRDNPLRGGLAGTLAHSLK